MSVVFEEQLTVLGLAQVGKSLSSYKRQISKKPPTNWHFGFSQS